MIFARLQSQSRFKIGMFARQTGKTFTTTLDIVLGCLDAATAKQAFEGFSLS